MQRGTYGRSALAFVGLTLVIAIDIALAATFNPDRGELEFWIKLFVFFGGLLVWSAWIARRLSRGRGIIAAYVLLGCVSLLVLIGAVLQLAGSYPEAPPFPGREEMSIARIASGVYLLFAWVMVIWDSLREHKFP